MLNLRTSSEPPFTFKGLNTTYQPERILLFSFFRLANTQSLSRKAPAQHLGLPHERIGSFQLEPMLPRTEFRSSLESFPFLTIGMARPVPSASIFEKRVNKWRESRRLLSVRALVLELMTTRGCRPVGTRRNDDSKDCCNA